jgi:Tfp pilus assembly protein PilX
MMVVRRKTQRHHGAILLNVMIFLVIVSILLAGMGQLMVSDYSIGTVEANYSNSLAVAEAGVNYELRKISNDATQADQKQTMGTGGASYTTAAGKFQVYVTQRNDDGTESTPWTPGNNLWIYSTGGVNNLNRTIKVAAVPVRTNPPSNYAVFGVTQGLMNGSATTVNGDVGTNGFFNFNGHPSITGNVTFNGAGSNWQSPPNGTYSVIHNSDPANWQTVEALAVTTFGPQGLNYVATNNDNALASPDINGGVVLRGVGNQTFYGKPGGANYYLTSLTCKGNTEIVFDNTNGPINIWVGPSGASSTFDFQGGVAAIKMSQDPTKAVRIYIATTNDVILGGNDELDAGIYNVNNSGAGRIIFNGTPNIYGLVVGNTFTFNGNPTLGAVPGYFTPTGKISYYGCVQPWQEIGGIN